MTDTTNNTAAAPAANLAPWHTFAADYRERLAAYMAAITDSSDPVESAAQDARHDAQRIVWESLLAYPVTTPHQLAEKADLIVADSWDDGAGLGAIAADALIVAHGPDCRDWRAAVAAYEAARDAYNPDGPCEGTGNESEAEVAAMWEAYLDAWRALIDTPAPEAAATAYKVAAYIDVAHSELHGDKASNPDTLLRLLQDGSLPGTRTIVRLLQDANRQAGLSAACLSEGLDA